MTWTKVPDDHIDHTWALSDGAHRLYVAGLVFSNRALTDGVIPRDRLAGLMPKARPALVAELIQAGLWRAVGGGWEVADFHQDQPSREEVEAQRAYDAIRQRIRLRKDPEAKEALRPLEAEARQALFDARERRRAAGDQGRPSQRESQRESRRDSQRPDPTRPVPTRKGEVEDGTAAGTNSERSLKDAVAFDPSTGAWGVVPPPNGAQS